MLYTEYTEVYSKGCIPLKAITLKHLYSILNQTISSSRMAKDIHYFVNVELFVMYVYVFQDCNWWSIQTTVIKVLVKSESGTLN